MTTQYTPILKLALPVTGELSGTWGDVVNDNITSMIEQAVAGLATISTWTGNSHTLTTANGTTSESRCAMLVAQDGAGLSASGEIVCPASSKLYVLKNATSYQITLKTASGTGVAVASGNTAFLFCDGTNVNACVTTIVDGRVTGNLTVDGNATINGNTTLGNATSDTVTVTARVASNVLPSADNTYDLGSVANSWKDLYIDGTATMALVAISGGTINGVSIGATTPATFIAVDNLSLDGNTIASTNTNGNIVIAPNGTGDVYLDADTVRVGDAGAAVTLTSNGAGALTVTTGGAADLTLSTNSGATTGTIVIANGANGNITLTPDGTGDVILSADRVQIGDANTDTTLTTNGTGNLNLTTNNGTNSGTIQIAQGANGNITLTPNGTGSVSVPKLVWSNGTATRVPYLTTGGQFTDSANMTFDGTTLTVNSLSVTTGTTFTGGTANAVIYLNGSKQATTSANMTFNGTTLTVNDLTDSSLTSGRVVYATTGGNLTSSANLLYSGTDLTVYGITVGRGAGADQYSTAIGNGALSTNTASASSNTAVGRFAVSTLSSGIENAGFGRAALAATTSGSYNTGIGHYALNSNTTASNNTAVGYQAGYSNTTGTSTTAVGYQALYAQTTPSTGRNTAVGFQSAISLTTGNQNTAIGTFAMNSFTTGDRNTALGEQALYGAAGATGTDNVAIGKSAASAVSTGSYNVAIGANAYISGTTGGYNVAVGADALRSNTTATDNTAVGWASLYSNTTGASNVAVGNIALYSTTTGANNTAMGHQALRFNTTASNNTAVGYQAGYSNTTGSENTLVGRQAGYANTTATGGVSLGYQAGNANTTGNYNIFIGTFAGQGSGSSITGGYNTVIGTSAGATLTTGTYNTFVGAAGQVNQGSGGLITTGSKNTILGPYNGNQGGLDIRTASNYIVLSDGDGNPRVIVDGGGFGGIGVVPANQYAAGGGAAWQIGGATNIWNYAVAGNYQTRIYNNAYLDTGAGERYLNTGSASMVQMADGRFFVKSVGSGSAGALASFTTVLDVKVAETLALQGATSQTGTGITFPATQNASSNANTLDDYEEGNWTAGLSFGGGTTGITYGAQNGSYIKIGSQVTAIFNIILTNKGSSTGSARVTGLPFTTTSGSRGGGSITYANAMGTISNCGGLLALVEAGQTFFLLRYFNTSSFNSTDLTESSFSNTSEFWGIVTYTV
jgi:hypothetical protein